MFDPTVEMLMRSLNPMEVERFNSRPGIPKGGGMRYGQMVPLTPLEIERRQQFGVEQQAPSDRLFRGGPLPAPAQSEATYENDPVAYMRNNLQMTPEKMDAMRGVEEMASSPTLKAAQAIRQQLQAGTTSPLSPMEESAFAANAPEMGATEEELNRLIPGRSTMGRANVAATNPGAAMAEQLGRDYQMAGNAYQGGTGMQVSGATMPSQRTFGSQPGNFQRDQELAEAQGQPSVGAGISFNGSAQANTANSPGLAAMMDEIRGKASQDQMTAASNQARSNAAANPNLQQQAADASRKGSANLAFMRGALNPQAEAVYAKQGVIPNRQMMAAEPMLEALRIQNANNGKMTEFQRAQADANKLETAGKIMAALLAAGQTPEQAQQTTAGIMAGGGMMPQMGGIGPPMNAQGQAPGSPEQLPPMQTPGVAPPPSTRTIPGEPDEKQAVISGAAPSLNAPRINSKADIGGRKRVKSQADMPRYHVTPGGLVFR